MSTEQYTQAELDIVQAFSDMLVAQHARSEARDRVEAAKAAFTQESLGSPSVSRFQELIELAITDSGLDPASDTVRQFRFAAQVARDLDEVELRAAQSRLN